MKRQILRHTPGYRGRAFAALALICMAALLAPSGYAQVYRIVGPDGKVSFSDQPPPLGSGNKAVTANVSSSGGATVASLPFELRQVATKFPVTLYSSDDCLPCGGGRSMLTSRGIPFTEKTVNTFDDVEALKRLSAASSLPLLTIGSQHLKGFSDAEWTQFLDAAGYPPKSALPAAYRRPAATPLVLANTAPIVAPPNSTQPGAPAATRADTPVIKSPSAGNPAGIQF